MLEENSYSPWEGCEETPHPPVCIQLAKLIKTGGLSLPFSNLEIQALQRQKKNAPKKGDLREEVLEEEVHQPSKASHSRSHRQPCPEEVQGILQPGVQPQDLPARALAVPGVVDDVARQFALLVQRQLGGDAGFGLGLA